MKYTFDSCFQHRKWVLLLPHSQTIILYVLNRWTRKFQASIRYVAHDLGTCIWPRYTGNWSMADALDTGKINCDQWKTTKQETEKLYRYLHMYCVVTINRTGDVIVRQHLSGWLNCHHMLAAVNVYHTKISFYRNLHCIATDHKLLMVWI